MTKVIVAFFFNFSNTPKTITYGYCVFKDTIDIRNDMRVGVNRETHLNDILLHVVTLVKVIVH